MKKLNCPLDGTTYAGYCVENVALIRFKSGKCNHVKDCEAIKERLDKEKAEKQKEKQNES